MSSWGGGGGGGGWSCWYDESTSSVTVNTNHVNLNVGYGIHCSLLIITSVDIDIWYIWHGSIHYMIVYMVDMAVLLAVSKLYYQRHKNLIHWVIKIIPLLM